MASLGRESTMSVSPFRLRWMQAKKVLFRKSTISIFWTFASRILSRSRMRSCVIGREKLIFSSSVAMALASKSPIQIGTARLPSRSFRITMGVLVSGSMVRPDTFISTNI